MLAFWLFVGTENALVSVQQWTAAREIVKCPTHWQMIIVIVARVCVPDSESLVGSA